MKIKSISKHVLAIVLSLAVLASTLMLNTFSAFAEAAPADTSVWDGNLDNLPTELSLLNAGEKNSPENPYLIQTAADFVYFGKQLDKAGKNTKGNYYKLTTDIYFNDTTPGDSGAWYEKENLNDWLTTLAFTTDQQGFHGTLDGDGHVIHGIYINTTNQYASIFGYMQGYGATIKNLGVEDSYIKSTHSDSYVGVFAGNTHNWIGGNFVFENCYAADSVILEGKRTSGIIASTQINANGNNYKLIFRNCISSATLNGTSSKAAYLAAWYYATNVSVENCYSTQSGAAPIRNINSGNAMKNAETISATFKNCFTFQYSIYWNGSKDVNITDGVTLLSTLDTITGISARKSMSGFDFVNDWFAEEGKLPQLRCFVDTSSAKEATEWWKVWDGTVPDKRVSDGTQLWNKGNVPFDGGSGTSGDPYKISTPWQLAYLCAYTNWYIGDKYFELTDDIYLNDVSNDAWMEAENNPHPWVLSGDNNGFRSAHLNGNGHTIYGLYINKEESCAGLFAKITGTSSIENLRISKSYVNNNRDNNYSTSAALVGYLHENATMTINNCVIEDSVQIINASGCVGGFIGNVGKNVTITINNCYSGAMLNQVGKWFASQCLVRAFVGSRNDVTGATYNISNSYAASDCDLIYSGTNTVSFDKCYNTYADSTETAVTVMQKSDMLSNGLTDVLNVFPKLGNVNGDENADVDICDLVILKKFELGMGVNIDIYSSDVNNDREINGMDFDALQKYILTDATVFQ